MVEAGLGTPATSECITVEQTTLDDFLLARGLPTPRLVKIDVEGAEIRVLKGARHLLAGSTEILCERHPYAWVAFGNSLDELKALARANGRRVRYLDREDEIGERAVYGIVALER